MIPTDAIKVLRAWVEDGEAPETLPASSEYPVNASSAYAIDGTEKRTLKLCPYPTVEQFKGGGLDPSKATSWECVEDSRGFEAFHGPDTESFIGCVGGPGWYG